MLKQRRKISAVVRDFKRQINSLKKHDSDNQSRFNNGTLNKEQLHLLTEGIFFNGFREYENFIRDVFLLYCQGRESINGKGAHSFIKPKNFNHSEELIQSSMPFLDWSSADEIIKRSELFLRNGYPIKYPYTSNKQKINDFKKIRNHIAHNSTKSLNGYIKVLNQYYRVIPLRIPRPGELLLLRSRRRTSTYKLIEFFDILEKLSNDLTII